MKLIHNCVIHLNYLIKLQCLINEKINYLIILYSNFLVSN